jgi:hypothetical protein
MTPSRFKEELQRFDKRLDFVWNGRKSRYEVIGEDARHKKYLIASFGIGKIETLGLQFIRDMASVSPRQQTAKEINRRIDRIVEETEKAEQKAFDNSINDRGDEAWEHFQYAEGSRVSFATIGMKEEVQIRDKRRFIDDSKRTMAADPKDARDSVNAKTVIVPIER